MVAINQARRALVARILEGEGKASHAQRRAAFDNAGLTDPLRTLINKVARHAYKITDEDITGARVSGLNEDQIFEVVVCAAIGQATRQYETALAALKAATEKE
jgi:hypothetical protein